ncbi:hypothetical protein [Mucilaginibacter aquaedulcis]|nr:hypothetical protein [Mucilaginibacter aquaedulcis]MDN3548907.1 hypothetical protein [Mucilaginibacter aquaedulcis]
MALLFFTSIFINKLAISEPKLHIGRKIGKIRELRGMKQKTLAAELGISQ